MSIVARSALPRPLRHGSCLPLAVKAYGLPFEDRFDPFAGINPAGRQVPPAPEYAWRRLPEVDDGLETAARRDA